MRKRPTKKILLNFTAHFITEADGGFSVIIPALPGCNTQGDTYEEAFRNAQDAIQLYLKSLAAHGEPIPVEGDTAVTRINVSVPARTPVRV